MTHPQRIPSSCTVSKPGLCVRVAVGGAVGLGRDGGGAVERARGTTAASFPHSHRKWPASARRWPGRVSGEAAQPPGARRLSGVSGWRGGGFCAQTSECGKYPVYPSSPSCGSDSSSAARGLGVPVRVRALHLQALRGACPRGVASRTSPPKSSLVSGKAAVFLSSLSFLLRTVLPETIGLLVFYFSTFF